MNNTTNKSRLMDYTLRLVSKKRYTVKEIQKKLFCLCAKHPDVEKNIVDEVVNRLIELKYLDDRAFARDYIMSRIQFRPRGIFLIKQELRVKGIDKNIVNDGFDGVDYDESQACVDLISKKNRLWGKYPLEKRKSKAFAFLFSKGFPKEAIYKALKSCYSLSVE